MQESPAPDWYETIEQNVQKELDKGIKNGDYKFYNVDRLLRAAKYMHEHQPNCHTCKLLRKDIEDISGNLAYYLNTSPKSRKAYEQASNKIITHLKQAHGIITKTYLTALYSFYGLLAGAALGLSSWLFYSGEPVRIATLVASALGLVLGRSLGARKEARMDTEKKIL